MPAVFLRKIYANMLYSDSRLCGLHNVLFVFGVATFRNEGQGLPFMSYKTGLPLAIVVFFALSIFCRAQESQVFIDAKGTRKDTLSRNFGLRTPQTPDMLPRSKVPPQVPELKAKRRAVTEFVESGWNRWEIRGGWELADEETMLSAKRPLFEKDFDTTDWHNAVVPGTVLTTLVEAGVYPDPYYGLNNMAIPDDLCRKEWWYRIRFKQPKRVSAGERVWLNFEGINYRADVWFNGEKLGGINGAFSRGIFEVGGLLEEENILAVKIYPPPNPGISHAASARDPIGPNGGQLCLDGPTFISSEGWDWVPTIRDRNIGIWQGVYLSYTGDVIIKDPFVVADLPLPATDSAELRVSAEVSNCSDREQSVGIKGEIDGGISFEKTVELDAGESGMVVFNAEEFPVLRVANPRLWWPNGYGKQELYNLRLTVEQNGNVTQEKRVRFGIREFTYELTVDTPQEQDVRIEFSPVNDIKNGDMPFNTAHRRKVEKRIVVPSLKEGVKLENFKRLEKSGIAPYLVIRCNGVRIFCRGGNWGMDDAMKRVSRARLEPAMRLHREQGFNMIRNWTGEQTEREFYELCDEYGMLVWNDFWISTEGYNQNVNDEDLFMANVGETIRRFRNHPSIAVWCPRNEGFATYALEPRLQKATASLDGTRFYSPTTWYMNLSANGPYELVEPKKYWERAKGFSTEIGIVSFPTAESMRKFIPEPDIWPVGDLWFYHDLSYGHEKHLNAIKSLYGDSATVDEFSRKAQLFNYDNYRRIFEAWNSGMWKTTAGVLLWMSHPAWPSFQFQTYTWDFETHGAFYGSKKACEPIHIQMNYDGKILVVNSTRKALPEAVVKISRHTLDGRRAGQGAERDLGDVGAEEVREVMTVDLPALDAGTLVRLELYSKGGLVSANDYLIQGRNDFRDLDSLAPVDLKAELVDISTDKGTVKATLEIHNSADVVALAVKLNVRDSSTGKAVLPAYISDGYFHLLPGEKKRVSVDFSGSPDGRSISSEAHNMERKTVFEF